MNWQKVHESEGAMFEGTKHIVFQPKDESLDYSVAIIPYGKNHIRVETYRRQDYDVEIVDYYDTMEEAKAAANAVMHGITVGNRTEPMEDPYDD